MDGGGLENVIKDSVVETISLMFYMFFIYSTSQVDGNLTCLIVVFVLNWKDEKTRLFCIRSSGFYNENITTISYLIAQLMLALYAGNIFNQSMCNQSGPSKKFISTPSVSRSSFDLVYCLCNF